MGDIISLSAGDVEHIHAPISLAPEDVERVSIDKGPEARRAEAGLPAGPKTKTDDELDLNPGPIKQVKENPGVVAAAMKKVGLPTFSLNDQLTRPTTAEEGKAFNKNVDLANADVDITGVARNALALGAGGVVGRGVSAGAKALGAGRSVAAAAGGAAGAASTSTLAEDSPKDIAASAATGGVLSGAMDYTAKRTVDALATKTFKALGRAGSEGTQEQLLKYGKDDVNDVLKRYEIGGIEKPRVAHEAVILGMDKAKAAATDALEIATKPGVAKSIQTEAIARYNTATRDLEVLKTVKPIVSKLSVADQFRESFGERLKSAPIATLKDAGSSIVKAPIKAVAAPFSAADMALANLVAAKQRGAISPDLVNAAISAGVAPAVVQRLTQ